MIQAATLSGKTAIISGASVGLGKEIARTYAKAGANLVLAARDATALESLVCELRSDAVAGQKIIAHACDLTADGAAESLVHLAEHQIGGLHALVNNAGTWGPKGALEEINWQEWIYTVQINLLASVALCRAVLPIMKRQCYGKIIQLSGGGATKPMPRTSAYAASKAAVVRFAETLAEEVRAYRIDVNSIAPGAMNTRMLDEMLAAGPEKIGAAAYAAVKKQELSGGDSPANAAALALFLASPESDGITAKLISAVWDNWQNFPAYRGELTRSDVYTLRRIAGRDRGLSWGDK
jgi:NAD(P)-dependent dehydrogenase (short-subunit alcohol dehydrogenase family)